MLFRSRPVLPSFLRPSAWLAHPFFACLLLFLSPPLLPCRPRESTPAEFHGSSLLPATVCSLARSICLPWGSVLGPDLLRLFLIVFRSLGLQISSAPVSSPASTRAGSIQGDLRLPCPPSLGSSSCPPLRATSPQGNPRGRDPSF